ncbi:MAG TPA: hypothetical protein PLV68_09400, partial [Ilumatobacteraceae bacterium]|nr:hypothetical protein [Ilumatobacteraceae bacterium]
TGRSVRDLDIYGTFLEALVTQGGYVEYDVDDVISRRTAAGCDVSQRDARPNLFVFAYDWRQDNAVSAVELADYIECVRRFHPSGAINVVTHSMGSLIARRYVLDHPEADIGRMITVGAPWLGAPKLVYTLQTGVFAPPIASDPIIARLAQRFTATHQLMAAELYHVATGQPVFIEDGWDINGNDVTIEQYSYEQLAMFLDGQSPVSDPAANATAFHSYATPRGAQVDWRDDQTGIEYFHVTGLQMANNTIGQVVARSTPSCLIGTTWFCSNDEHFVINRAWGDGTVPLVSATRHGANGFDFNAPGATVLTAASGSVAEDFYSEHTGLAANPHVIGTIIDLLAGGTLATTDDGGDANANAAAGITAGSTPTIAGAPIQTSLLVGPEAAAQAAADNATSPLRTITVLGATDVHVADGSGNSTRPPAGIDSDIRFSVPGVSDTILGDDAWLLTLPATVLEQYAVTFTATRCGWN